MRDAPRELPPAVVDLGALRTTEGYFLARSVPQRAFPPEPRDSRADWEFGSTFRDSAMTLRDQVLRLIRGARHKVFVTSFILGDDDLAQELIAAAERLAGGVYVISELSEASIRRGLGQLAGAKVDHKVEVEKKRFTSLTTCGVAVRGHENCHAKFVVVDDEIAWIGSANLETGAFTTVGEVGVVTRDRREVDRLARMFARMWLAGCAYELPSTVHDYEVRERRERTPAPFTVPSAGTSAAPCVVWTDDTERTLLAAVHDVIDSARTRLVLASFSLNGMEERPDLLVDPVARAVARGVRVHLLLRAMNWRVRHRRDAGLLHQLGAEVVADDNNHAKAVVADDRTGVLFSANFDAQHGLDPGSGIEVGARLDGTAALPHLARYLDHALACATRQYVDRPTVREVYDGLAEPRRRWWPLADRWPLPDQALVQASNRTWARLHAAAATGPVLWRKEPDQPVELLAGAERFRLRADGRGAHSLECLSESGLSATDLAEQWWRRPDAHRYEHGYCGAVLQRI